MSNQVYHTAKLAEIPTGFLKSCVEFLRNEFPEETKQEIRNLYASNGPDWAIEYHMFWGMGVRNMLRTAGFRDDQLPDQNWDDYYIPVVELAVGIRTMEGI